VGSLNSQDKPLVQAEYAFKAGRNGLLGSLNRLLKKVELATQADKVGPSGRESWLPK
jgi:hypothetical protein